MSLRTALSLLLLFVAFTKAQNEFYAAYATKETDGKAVDVVEPAIGAGGAAAASETLGWRKNKVYSLANYDLPHGFPVGPGASSYDTINVCSMGYVTFGAAYCTERTPKMDRAKADRLPMFAAPFWSAFDFVGRAKTVALKNVLDNTQNPSKIYFKSITKVAADENLKTILKANSVPETDKVAFVITWEKMVLPAATLYKTTQFMTFQLILVTDAVKESHALFLYNNATAFSKDLSADWQVGKWLDVFTGVRTTADTIAKSTNNLWKISEAKTAVHALTTADSKNQKKTCMEWKTEVEKHAENPKLAEVNKLSKRCPCTRYQAKDDPRYTAETVAGLPKHECFKLWEANAGDLGEAVCCYDADKSGALVSFASKAGYKNSVTRALNDSLNLNDQTSCCTQGGTCSQYGYLRPLPTCESYKVKQGFVYGWLHFRTFAGGMFDYPGVGDFRLVEIKDGKGEDGTTALKDILLDIRTENVANKTSKLSDIGLKVGAKTVVVRAGGDKLVYALADDANKDLAIGATVTEGDITVKAMSNNLFTMVVKGANDVYVKVYFEGVTKELSLAVFYLDDHSRTVTGLLNSYSSDGKITSKDGTVNPINKIQASQEPLFKTYKVATADKIFKTEAVEPTADYKYAPMWTDIGTDKTKYVENIKAKFDADATAKTYFEKVNSTCIDVQADFMFSCYFDGFLGGENGGNNVAAFATIYQKLATSGANPPQQKEIPSKDVWKIELGKENTFELASYTPLKLADYDVKVYSAPVGVTFNETTGAASWTPTKEQFLSDVAFRVSVAKKDGAAAFLLLMRAQILNPDCVKANTDVPTEKSKWPALGTSYSGRAIAACMCKAGFSGPICDVRMCSIGLECFANGEHSKPCKDSNGKCACPVGFKDFVTGGKMCYFDDVCITSPSGKCANGKCNPFHPKDAKAVGSDYQCKCDDKHTWSKKADGSFDKTSCSKIDECASGLLKCTAANQTCDNNACVCKLGYEMKENVCVRKDYCAKAADNQCNADQGSCTNEFSPDKPSEPYTCTCNATKAFFPNGANRCEAKDICSSPSMNNCEQKCVWQPAKTPKFLCACHNAVDWTLADGKCSPKTACTAEQNTTCSGQNASCANGNCFCEKGFEMTGDTNKTCTKIDHCSKTGNAAVCKEQNTKCVSKDVGYECACADNMDAAKYRFDQLTHKCVEIDQCKKAGFCGANAACERKAEADYICKCKDHYEGADPKKGCSAIAKCSKATDTNPICPSGTTCVNIMPNNHICKCPNGLFYKAGASPPCTRNKYTKNVKLRFTRIDYTPELANKSSPQFAEMSNKIKTHFESVLHYSPLVEVRSFSKGSVVAEVSVSSNTDSSNSQLTTQFSHCNVDGMGECGAEVSDLNECEVGSHDCSDAQRCVDTASAFNCKCLNGYLTKGFLAGRAEAGYQYDVCEDKDECKTYCREQSTTKCTNTPGSYICACDKGYVQSTFNNSTKEVTCKNPCDDKPCKNDGACTFAAGSTTFPYDCMCAGGYRGATCEDFDEKYESMRRTAIIVGVIFGLLFLMALIVLIYLCIKRKWSQYFKEDMYYGNFSEGNDVNGVVRVRRRSSSGKYSNINLSTYPSADSTIPRARLNESQAGGQQNRAYDSTNLNQGQSGQQRSDYF